MDRLIEISQKEDIIEKYRDTPISLLLEYHNLNRPAERYTNAPLLVGMCIDNRKRLCIPENFTYIIRSAGANLRNNEFQISFAVSMKGVLHFALIGHNDCGMREISNYKDEMVEGLVTVGWDKEKAIRHFDDHAHKLEIGDEIDFTSREVKRLRLIYPKLCIAPLIYNVHDNRLYLIREDD